MKHFILPLALLISIMASLSASAQRDPLKQPFSKTSIWNMPIHKDAQYIPAEIGAPLYGFYSDEEVIIMKPTAPSTGIYENFADWDASKDRCIKQGKLIFSAPIPSDFVYSKNEWKGTTPNSGLAVLMADGVTIKHTQPFARCTAGTDATSHYKFPSQNLTGDGTRGGHGGSGLSTLGGTIRLGELVPGGKINHALKIDIYGAKYCFYDAVTKGYRWPAVTADGYASENYGTKGTPVKDCRMGALLAIPTNVTIESLNLQTEPGKILAEAFRNYGAYLVDDTAWDAVNICTEHSPDGTVLNEFSDTWGFEFETSNGQPFAKDLEKILKNLNVVINNTATTIGGGLNADETNRLAPMACDFAPAGSGQTCNDAATSSRIINIMPTGNSLTQANDPGYRGYLYHLLDSAKYQFDFVGSKHDGLPTNGGDPDHSGFGGYVIGPNPSKGDDWDPYKHGDILFHLDQGFKIMSNNADLILLEIGINDFFNDLDNYDPSVDGAVRLDSLIAKIYRINPEVVMLVSNLTPVTWDSNFGNLYNSQVPSIISKYKQLGRKCYLVDLRKGISWKMDVDISADLLHPTASGYKKMANLFYSKLQPVLDSMNMQSGGKVPEVSLTQPQSNDTFNEPATIQLLATATDSDGQIRNVMFYSGTEKIGEDANNPYSLEWRNVLTGNYSITAVAVDNSGNSTRSLPVIIKVESTGQIIYQENFDDNLAQDWLSVNGSWKTQDGKYVDLAANGVDISIYNKNTFFNYTFSAIAKPDWNNIYGLVFNYQDAANYYFLELDADPLDAKLKMVKDGTESTLKSAQYKNGGAGIFSSIEITNSGTTTSVKVNNELIFDQVATTQFVSGKIGLYAWWNPLTFDDVQVIADGTSAIKLIENKESDLKIFPNPVNNGNITFVIPTDEKNIKMEIFDNTGKLVFSKINITEKEFKLASSCLRGSGMYHVRVISSLNVRYAKLIIN